MFYPKLDAILLEFLAEDLGSGDISSSALEGLGERRGWLTARKPGVIAGFALCPAHFRTGGGRPRGPAWSPTVTKWKRARFWHMSMVHGHLLLQGSGQH